MFTITIETNKNSPRIVFYDDNKPALFADRKEAEYFLRLLQNHAHSETHFRLYQLIEIFL